MAYYFLSAIILVAAILLVIVVLIQKSKGGGLASNFAGSNQILGVRKTTDSIEKITWGLAVAICFLSIATTFVDAPTLTNKAKINAPVQTEQATTAFPTEKAAPTTPATTPATPVVPAKPATTPATPVVPAKPATTPATPVVPAPGN